MKNIITASLITAFSNIDALAMEQYLCEFGSKVSITNNDISNPKSKAVKNTSKYTFLIKDGDTKGSYINLQYGTLLPITVNINALRATFMEFNTSDNLFVVTVFLNKANENPKPAIWTQHSYTSNAKNDDHYVPQIALGSCFIKRD